MGRSSSANMRFLVSTQARIRRHRILCVWVCACVWICAFAIAAMPPPAESHQRHVGGSLLALMVRADGFAFVQTLEPTQKPPAAYTRVLLRQALGGKAPSGSFLLRSATSPARYPADQNAIVLFKQRGDQWHGVQLLGEELVFEQPVLDEETRRWLSALWKATHDASPKGQDLGGVLRQGLRLPHPKLRQLAALDIEELAHHKPGLTPETQRALKADLEQPDLDPEVRFALSRALRTD